MGGSLNDEHYEQSNMILNLPRNANPLTQIPSPYPFKALAVANIRWGCLPLPNLSSVGDNNANYRSFEYSISDHILWAGHPVTPL